MCIGWAEGSPDLIKRLASCGVIRSGGGQNPLSAAIVHSILEENSLGPHIKTLHSTFNSRKRALCDALDEFCSDCSYTEPNGGYFVWLQLPSNVTGDALLKQVTDHGVAFTPGSRCSLGLSPDSSNHIRLSFAFYNEVELREGIKRLADALRSIQSSDEK